MGTKSSKSTGGGHERWKALNDDGIWNDRLDSPKTHYETVLWALAHIGHACEIQSRELASAHNLSGLELACLRRIVQEEGATIEDLATRSPLSRNTLIEIHERLESRRLVTLYGGDQADSPLFIAPTESGINHALSAPPPIHERFARALLQLPEDEQKTIALSFRRVVELIEEENANNDSADA